MSVEPERGLEPQVESDDGKTHYYNPGSNTHTALYVCTMRVIDLRCPRCNGAGALPTALTTVITRCPRCKGTGSR